MTTITISRFGSIDCKAKMCNCNLLSDELVGVAVFELVGVAAVTLSSRVPTTDETSNLSFENI